MASASAWKRAVGSVRVRITLLATLVFAVAFTVGSMLLVNAVHDSLDWGDDSTGAAPIVLAPFNIPLHALKHVAYTVVYAVDFVVCPFYLLANITPRNREDLEPIGIYRLDEGYPWKSAPWPEFED